MELFLTEFSRGDNEDDLNAVSLIRRLLSAVEYQFEPVKEHTILTEEELSKITNSNCGNPSSRKSRKRAKSWGERFLSGKRIRKTKHGMDDTGVGGADLSQTYSHSKSISYGSRRLSQNMTRSLLDRMHEP